MPTLNGVIVTLQAVGIIVLWMAGVIAAICLIIITGGLIDNYKRDREERKAKEKREKEIAQIKYELDRIAKRQKEGR